MAQPAGDASGLGNRVVSAGDYMGDRLDLFTPPTIEGNILETKSFFRSPDVPLDAAVSGPITFTLPRQTNDYIDMMQIMLHGAFTIREVDSATNAEKVVDTSAVDINILNYGVSAFFKDIEVKFNNTVVSSFFLLLHRL